MNGEAGPKAGLDTLQDHGSRSPEPAASAAERSLRRQLARLEHRIGFARQASRDVGIRLRELETERASLQEALTVDDVDASTPPATRSAGGQRPP